MGCWLTHKDEGHPSAATHASRYILCRRQRMLCMCHVFRRADRPRVHDHSGPHATRVDLRALCHSQFRLQQGLRTTRQSSVRKMTTSRTSLITWLSPSDLAPHCLPKAGLLDPTVSPASQLPTVAVSSHPAMTQTLAATPVTAQPHSQGEPTTDAACIVAVVHGRQRSDLVLAAEVAHVQEVAHMKLSSGGQGCNAYSRCCRQGSRLVKSHQSTAGSKPQKQKKRIQVPPVTEH